MRRRRGLQYGVVAALFTALAVVSSCSADGPAEGPGGGGTQSTGEPSPDSSTLPMVQADDVQVPELVGQQESAAVEVLESLGINDYRVEERNSLRPAGEVLDQLPSPGAAVRGSVILTVAVPLPPMPDYAGVRIGDARAELEAWGVAVVEESDLSTERPAGEVLGSLPQAGEQVGAEVVLRVAFPPVIGRLDIDATEVVSQTLSGSAPVRYGSVDIDGDFYENSTYATSSQPRRSDMAYWEYNLSRDWEYFEAVAGLLDDSSFEQRASFRVVLDGSTIWEKGIDFGESDELSINVSGGLRLRLEVIALGDGPIGVGWGDAKLLGIPGNQTRADASSTDDD